MMRTIRHIHHMWLTSQTDTAMLDQRGHNSLTSVAGIAEISGTICRSGSTGTHCKLQLVSEAEARGGRRGLLHLEMAGARWVRGAAL